MSLVLWFGLDLTRVVISSMLLRFCKSMHMILKGKEIMISKARFIGFVVTWTILYCLVVLWRHPSGMSMFVCCGVITPAPLALFAK